jgi:hypothetical protein
MILVTGIFILTTIPVFCILPATISMVKKFYSRPFLSLLPFLLLYSILIVIQNNDALFGDEGRYLQFAHNLLNGFYSPPQPDINLWNGPGFPIYLLPFVVMNVPLLIIKLSNALLHYFTLILFYKTIRRFLDEKKSFIYTAMLGCYYMPFKGLPHILSETLVIFLIASITYFSVVLFSKPHEQKNGKLFFLLSILLSFLALTKVIFGTVFLIAGIIFLLSYIVNGNKHFRNSFLLMIAALVMCLPYLVYTHSITGRIFYWSNASGMSLYWMSNPVEGEYGEWHNDSLTSSPLDISSQQILKSNHKEEYNEIYLQHGVARDDKFKSFAIQHAKEHPGKMFRNWLANISRMLFNYPVSYTPFKLSTLANMLVNIPLLLLLLYSGWLTWKRRKEINFVWKFLLVISIIYLAGSSIVSSYDRMFYILIPIFGCWIAYSLSILRPSEGDFQKSK